MKEQTNNEDTSTQPTPGQIWRERLEKAKGATSKESTKRADSTCKNGTQLASSTPQNSNRKSRKGMRPG